MARRGRKPTGTNLVEHLEGSERAKSRLKGILETLSADRTIPEVCEELGIGESMFHRVRSEVLQAALDRLEPRPLGRPPLESSSPQDVRIAELETEVLRLQMELQAAEGPPRAGREAAAVGQVTKHRLGAAPGKKTTARSRRRQRKRLHQDTNHPHP